MTPSDKPANPVDEPRDNESPQDFLARTMTVPPSIRLAHLVTDIGLTLWGSDCILDGGCGGNTTPDSMVCDGCGSDRHTIALWWKAPDDL